MSARLTRQEKRALVGLGIAVLLFFAVPWIAAIAAAASGFEVGTVEP